jgi:hypothetical protein
VVEERFVVGVDRAQAASKQVELILNPYRRRK